jgi:hypothetical protein
MHTYTLIDLYTDLVYGPYATFNEARSRANNFTRWEIIRDCDETSVDWSSYRLPVWRFLTAA